MAGGINICEYAMQCHACPAWQRPHECKYSASLKHDDSAALR